MNVEIKGVIVPDDEKEVYDYYGISNTSPSDVISAINQAGGDLLNVEISTCYGGSIFAGSQIYSALKSYSGGVHILITALAASAASIIAMAGFCEMAPTAMMMVHHVSNSAEGNFRVMDKNSEMLQQADKAMAAAYTTKSGMSESDALDMMDQEMWLTAQQALERKLVDKVMFSDTKQLTNAFTSSMLPSSVIEKTKNMLHPITVSNETNEIETLKAKLALQLEL